MATYLTHQQACAELGIGRITLYRLANARKIRAFQMPNGWRYRLEDLEAYRDSCLNTNNAERPVRKRRRAK
jgi:excisionase family DNA binding protein